MEEDSNGKAEETQKEETHRNGVETVKELFEEVKAELLHRNESSSESSSDEEEEKTEPVEEVVLESVLDPVLEPKEEAIELESEDVVEKATELESEDVVEKATELEYTDVVEKVTELESEDIVEKEGIEQIDLPSEETEVPPPPPDRNMGETSEVVDMKASEDSSDVPSVDIGNKAEISPETTRTSPIISISNRTIQPTSWRSCCGLFEVLRRNK